MPLWARLPALVLVLVGLAMALASHNTHVIPVPGAPTEIAEYIVEFVPAVGTNPEFIRHNVRLKNNADVTIVAVEVRFLTFDAFDRFMQWPLSGFALLRLQAGTETALLNWHHTPRSAFAFDTYGTGVAYVNAVRFSDGVIWRADPALVVSLLDVSGLSLTIDDIAED